jgi:UDP-N-acetylmuramyl pentapeptide phosphotransferase/UDP-N-acetylglucosamine-1-phosphate transferase
MLLAALLQDHSPRHAGLIFGTLLLAVISWLDDRKGIGAGMRLSTHILAACLGSLTFAPNAMLFHGVLPFWCDRTILIVGWAWFINLYNFMDGIDGITGTETISIATGVCLVLAAIGLNDPFADVLSLLLTGACLGFLALNWHPAKIFLGDVGSVPLGYLAGYLLLIPALKGYFLPALIIPLYYLADSGITLGRRALNGEKVWQAHRQHFYQRAAQGIGRHNPIVIWIIITNIALITAAIVAVPYPWPGFLAGALVVALLLLKMHKVSATTG